MARNPKSKFRDNSTLRAIAHVALRAAFGGMDKAEAEEAIKAEAVKLGVVSLADADEVFGGNRSVGEIEDPRITALIQEAIAKDADGHLLNTLYTAPAYNGVLKAAVVAGSFANIARDVGVSPQAVQKWAEQGYVPLARIPEFENLYGVDRREMVNQKYFAVIAEPQFPAA